jgi:hypothetical protein
VCAVAKKTQTISKSIVKQRHRIANPEIAHGS